MGYTIVNTSTKAESSVHSDEEVISKILEMVNELTDFNKLVALVSDIEMRTRILMGDMSGQSLVNIMEKNSLYMSETNISNMIVALKTLANHGKLGSMFEMAPITVRVYTITLTK